MDRKEAKKYYYFNDRFYADLMTFFKDEVRIFSVHFGDKVICSSIVLGQGEIAYDYLRGTDPDYLDKRPNDLLIDEIVLWVKSRNYKYFVLGGGSSSAPDDRLLVFKKSFSSTTTGFYIYKKVYDKKKYEELCAEMDKKDEELLYERASFFPEYSSRE